ncbi:hypothetical protein ABTD96_21055, partial [Acinetobacter baumannii]
QRIAQVARHRRRRDGRRRRWRGFAHGRRLRSLPRPRDVLGTHERDDPQLAIGLALNAFSSIAAPACA